MSLIPVYKPFLNGNEKLYVNRCLDTNWISSKGEFISKFENLFGEYIKASNVTSVSNGTVALHLALISLGIKPGDEVIVPSFTYVASINTIIQAGAVPVFVDSLSNTWQIDPLAVRKKITKKTKAIMVVHLYGHPCEMRELLAISKEFGLLIVEDCAEAFGTLYEGQHVGTFGDAATFSFFGNKTITTGEGGMVVVKDPECYKLACSLKNQGVSSKIMYWHDSIAFNYRMTNISAAIGLAQLEKAEEILSKKRDIAFWYKENLKGLPLCFHDESENVRHSFWMCSILLENSEFRDPLREYLDTKKIETRPTFFPAHLMPIYEKTQESYPVAEFLGLRGVNLPSYPSLTIEELTRVTNTIKNYFNSI